MSIVYEIGDDSRVDIGDPEVLLKWRECNKRPREDGYINGGCQNCPCKIRLNLEKL